MTTNDTPVIIDGVEHDRTYVVELEPGDVTAFDEEVLRVRRITDRSTIVYLTNGESRSYSMPGATMLTKRWWGPCGVHSCRNCGPERYDSKNQPIQIAR